jgi:hypothetical protein
MTVTVISDKFGDVLGVAEHTSDAIVNVLINAGKVNQFTHVINKALAPHYPYITSLEGLEDWEDWLRHQSVISLEKMFYTFSFDTFKLVEDCDKRY